MRHINDRAMAIDEVDGKYLTSHGKLLILNFPDFQKHITITNNGFKSRGLDIHIVGQDLKIGYIRIARVVEI